MAKKKKGYVRESTLMNYRYAIRRCQKYFPDCDMKELTKETVSEQFLRMSDSCSASSIYNVRQVMGSIYASAIEKEIVHINPFKKQKIPESASVKIVTAYSLEEQQRLMEAAEEDILGELYIFLLLTGLRKSEFLNLRWEDYDPMFHSISIRKSKTRTGVRTIALSPKAENILLRQPVLPHGYIFSTSKKARISVTSLKKLCHRLEKNVGFHVTCHRARHTFCTRMVMDAKVDPKTVCSISGHKSVAFLMQRYVTSDLARQHEALIKLEKFML